MKLSIHPTFSTNTHLWAKCSALSLLYFCDQTKDNILSQPTLYSNMQYVPVHEKKNFHFAICVVMQTDFQQLNFVSVGVMKILFSPAHQYDTNLVIKIYGTTWKNIQSTENMAEVTLKTITHMISKERQHSLQKFVWHFFF